MIESNANEVAELQQRRIALIDGAVRAGIAKGALAIENAAIANLTGSGEPYSYPVPIRSGFLRGSMKAEQPLPVLAIVFNSAEYAWAVHSGDVHEWAGNVKRPARPFLDDAVESTPWADIVIDAVSEKLIGGGLL